MELRPRHLRAIELLIGTDLNFTGVAAAVGVSTYTLRKWRRDPDFRRERDRRRDVLPHRMHLLRMETARRLLQDVICRLIRADEKLPLKEVSAMLAQLVGADFSRATVTPDEATADDGRSPASQQHAVAPEAAAPGEGSAAPAEGSVAGEEEETSEPARAAPMTTEEAEAIWAALEAERELEEVRRELSRAAQNPSDGPETAISGPEGATGEAETATAGAPTAG
jgi:hypothetical protein